MSESAQGVIFNIVAELFDFIQILHGTLSLGDFIEHLVQALGTNPAGCTFAAALVHGKFQEELCNIHHAVVFVHDNQSARAHHRADRNQIIIVNRDIIVLCGNTAAGRSAGLCRLKFLAVGNSAADFFNHLTQGCTHRDFHQTGVVDFSAERKDFCALGFFRTHGGEPFSAVADNQRNVRIGFHVVENRGLAEQSFFRRERRSGTGFAAVAFNRSHQRGFLTAHKRARTEPQADVEIKARAENILAEQS